LADSISTELQREKIDTASFNRLLFEIRTKRRSLGENYKSLLQEYISRAKTQEYTAGEMIALDRLGLLERYDGNYKQAAEYHNQSLDLAKKINDSLQMTYALSNLGQVYRMQDINTLAIKYFLLALSIQEKICDYRGAYYTQNTLGATYFVLEEFDKALTYLHKSSNAAQTYNDKRTLSFNYGCIGEVYLALNQPDSALLFFQQGKKFKYEAKYDRGIPVSDHLIGQAYFALGDIANAQKAFEEALTGHYKNNNERYQALCLAYLGKIYVSQNLFEKAYDNLNRARQIALRLNSLENLMIIEDALFALYRLTGKPEQAYAALSNKHAYRDSINIAKNAKSIHALEVEHNTRQKEQKIELLSSENRIKSQRIRFGIILIVLMILILILLAVLFTIRQRNAAMVEVGLKHRLSLSQMNPHFVSNAMSSIQKFLYTNDANSAAKYLEKFALLNRAVLEHSLVDCVTLDDEVTMLSHYLEFEKLRMNNSFHFVFEITDDLDVEMIRIPPLFIQPFVENAVKHGVNNMGSEGSISLRFVDQDEFLKVDIVDNGKGIDNNDTQSNHRSRSMEIVKKRLKLLKHKNKQLPELMIISNPSPSIGLHVTLYLPILSC
jgi:tetratricopeptide (TPR) repeat protein